jgi:hypothetical protein
MRRDYKTPIERAFRNHHGLVVPVSLEAHAELHANLYPPPKPHRELMLGILNNLEEYNLSNPLDGIEATIDYLETGRIRKHLILQIGYLTLGVRDE